MCCERVRAHLSAHLDGELPPELTAKIVDHLLTCDTCVAEMRSLARIVALLRSLPEQETPANLHGAISSALARARPVRRRTHASRTYAPAG